jgi:hypothetical protein
MFLKTETIVVIGQLLFIVVLSLIFSSTALSPLNNNGVEGFHSSSLEYTNILSPNTPTDDVYGLNVPVNDNTDCKRVNGFSKNGVFCSPLSKPESIDIYSKAKGDLTCESLGLYNSKGQLCLDENMKRMLTTRGANAVGGNGQIGSS